MRVRHPPRGVRNKNKTKLAQRMEAYVANHEFQKARFYSIEERKERDNLKELRKKYKLDNNPALEVRREEIERAVSQLLDTLDD